MKQIYAGISNAVLVCLFSAIFLINAFAAYFEYGLISNISKVISVIILLTLYFMLRNRMANVFLTIFLLSFLGDVFYVFTSINIAPKLSTVFYLGSYLLLIFVLLGKLKHIKYEGLVSVYLVIVLLLNSYFLYILYGVAKDNFSDNVSLILYLIHGITLIAMTFFAFAVYLSQETTQSIIFLVMVFCFVFSDVLNFICNLYVYFWLFEFFANMLHFASLILLFTYVYNHHRITMVHDKVSVDELIMKNSERITA